MEKLLSDIDISRSFPVATFLELEAAARSCRCFSLYFCQCHFLSSILRFIGTLEPHTFNNNFNDINKQRRVTVLLSTSLVEINQLY